MNSDYNIRDYHRNQWKECTERILKRDEYTCQKCGAKGDSVKLQVHHLRYIQGRKAWEYDDADLVTLCKGCHAERHGKIMPRSGWIYQYSEDLEDLSGECELCGNPIRFAHTIFHPDWGYLTVGCVCAENLTSTESMKEFEEERKKLSGRYKRYMNSNRWTHKKNGSFITLDDYNIEIWNNVTNIRLRIFRVEKDQYSGFNHRREIQTRKFFDSIDEAKSYAFWQIANKK